jgi:hypothetical protein
VPEEHNRLVNRLTLDEGAKIRHVVGQIDRTQVPRPLVTPSVVGDEVKTRNAPREPGKGAGTIEGAVYTDQGRFGVSDAVLGHGESRYG